MTHFKIMKLCDALQEARDCMLELNEAEDAKVLELLYQRYIQLYHEYIRR